MNIYREYNRIKMHLCYTYARARRQPTPSTTGTLLLPRYESKATQLHGPGNYYKGRYEAIKVIVGHQRSYENQYPNVHCGKGRERNPCMGSTNHLKDMDGGGGCGGRNKSRFTTRSEGIFVGFLR